jgi:hypothetical protein
VKCIIKDKPKTKVKEKEKMVGMCIPLTSIWVRPTYSVLRNQTFMVSLELFWTLLSYKAIHGFFLASMWLWWSILLFFYFLSFPSSSHRFMMLTLSKITNYPIICFFMSCVIFIILIAILFFSPFVYLFFHFYYLTLC